MVFKLHILYIIYFYKSNKMLLKIIGHGFLFIFSSSYSSKANLISITDHRVSFILWHKLFTNGLNNVLKQWVFHGW